MSTNDATPPTAAPTFRTTVFLEAVWLACQRHRCTLYGDVTGRVTFEFPDTAQLQTDLRDFRDNRAEIVPGRWEKVKRALRAAIDTERERARQEAEEDPDLRIAIAIREENERNRRIANAPNPYRFLQEARRNASRAEAQARIDAVNRAQRAARQNQQQEEATDESEGA